MATLYWCFWWVYITIVVKVFCVQFWDDGQFCNILDSRRIIPLTIHTQTHIYTYIHKYTYVSLSTFHYFGGRSYSSSTFSIGHRDIQFFSALHGLSVCQTCTFLKHYKRDADGLCHRLVTPIISDKYRIARDSESLDDRIKLFQQASLVIHRGDLRLGDTIGHGEFGGIHRFRPVYLHLERLSECMPYSVRPCCNGLENEVWSDDSIYHCQSLKLHIETQGSWWSQ